MPSEEREARRYEVFGWVQGVGFRHFVRSTAREMGLDGWVRNRRDGSVEVVAAGAPAVLVQFGRELQLGPPAARVDRVVEGIADPPPPGFAVRFE